MLEKFDFSDSLFTYVLHFSGQTCFLSTSQISFATKQLLALSASNVFINNNNHLSTFFRPIVSTVEDENFQSISVFYQVVLANVIRVLKCILVSSILWEAVLKEILFKLY